MEDMSDLMTVDYLGQVRPADSFLLVGDGYYNTGTSIMTNPDDAVALAEQSGVAFADAGTPLEDLDNSILVSDEGAVLLPAQVKFYQQDAADFLELAQDSEAAKKQFEKDGVPVFAPEGYSDAPQPVEAS